MLDIVLVHIIIAVGLVLFSIERFRIDLTSILILTILMVLGMFRPAFPSPDEAISGFSHRATVTIGALFILSGGS